MSSEFFWLMKKDLKSHFDGHLAQCKDRIRPVLTMLLIFFEEVLNKAAISKTPGWKKYMLISIWIYYANQEGKMDKLCYFKVDVPVKILWTKLKGKLVWEKTTHITNRKKS